MARRWKPRRPKKLGAKPTRGQVVKALDAVYSHYIRLKDADKYGVAKCVSCGVLARWERLQNGHYCARGNYNTRWMDMNCHVQCVGCNIFKKGNYPEYTAFMIEKYGADALQDLIKESKKVVKIETAELLDQIQKYKEIVDKLKKEKSCNM